MQGINILGTGVYLPEKIATNDDFAKIVDTNDEWITTRTGIKERRMSNGEPTWYMAAEACKNAIEKAGINPEQIDCIISSSVSPDYYFPSNSCLIQRAIGASNAFTIDINCACAGYVYGIDMARRYLNTDSNMKYALVIGAENLTKYVDYSDRSTCVLFGDGAGACVIEKSDKLYGQFLKSDGNGAKHMASQNLFPHNAFMSEEKFKAEEIFPALNEHFMYMNGKEVYKFATKAMPEAVEKSCENCGISISDLDLIIPHQANIRIIQTAVERLGLPIEKFFVNIEKYGNTSSASLAIALDEAITEGRIKRGQKLSLAGFGAGLTYAGIVFEY